MNVRYRTPDIIRDRPLDKANPATTRTTSELTTLYKSKHRNTLVKGTKEKAVLITDRIGTVTRISGQHLGGLTNTTLEVIQFVKQDRWSSRCPKSNGEDF
jgi:hypothetical protein